MILILNEDLEGIVENNEVEMSYYNDRIFINKGFNMIKKIEELGIGVEKLYGGMPQDIE